MWFPKRLLIEDFMSIQSATIVFNKGVATLIYGKNDFDDDQESNGSGKSAILEAISIALRNKPLRDTTTSELVRTGTKHSHIVFELWNSISKQTLLIDRTVFSNTKPSTCVLSINNKAQSHLIGVEDCNKEILRLIGISQEDLVNYYLISKEKYTAFLKMSDTKKKEMISRFSQSNLINPLFEQLDKDINEQAQLKLVIDTDVIRTQAKIEGLNETMEQHDPKVLEQERLDSIMDLEQDRNDLLGLHEQAEISRKKYAIAIQKSKKLLESLPKIDDLTQRIEKINTQRDEKDDVIDGLELEIKEANEILSKVEKNLAGIVACPKCSHQFVVGKPNVDVVKQQSKKKQIIQILTDIEVEKGQIRQDIDELKNKKKKLQLAVDQIQQQRTEFNKTIENEERNKQRQINEKVRIESLLADKQDQILKLRNPKPDDSLNKFNQQLATLKKDLIITQKKLAPVQKLHSQLVEESSLLTQFKTHLANKAIGSFESHANDYLIKTGSQLSIQLDGYKVTKTTRAIRENITATIVRNGDASNFGRMSSGEKARIEIAFIIAPQSLINSSCPSGGLDLLFMDEIVESVDSKGIGGILKSLNQIDRTIFVVTHATYNKPYPHTLTVHKHSDGIATIS